MMKKPSLKGRKPNMFMLSRQRVLVGKWKYDENGKLYTTLPDGQRCYDSDKAVRFDSGQHVANSWVKAFNGLMYLGMRDEFGHYFTTNDHDGVSRNASSPRDAYGYFMESDGEDGDGSRGIGIGSGDTVETNDDYDQDTRINHGVGTGEMAYGNHAYETSAVVGSNVDFEYRRTFLNSSGASIDVKEIVWKAYNRHSGGTVMFTLGREVITPITVADNETLEVIITARTTV